MSNSLGQDQNLWPDVRNGMESGAVGGATLGAGLTVETGPLGMAAGGIAFGTLGAAGGALSGIFWDGLSSIQDNLK